MIDYKLDQESEEIFMNWSILIFDRQFDLDSLIPAVQDDSIVVILGPTSCGKSTLLRQLVWKQINVFEGFV